MEQRVLMSVGGPAVISSSPSASPATQAMSQVVFNFDAALDAATIGTNDIVSFTGPGGANLINDVFFADYQDNQAGHQLTVFLSAESTPGQYTMVIGPHIADLSGHEMDQNGDGVAGGANDTATWTYNFQPPNVDFQPTGVTFPASVTARDTPHVVVTVRNNGTDEAKAFVRHAVYFSTDTTFDPGVDIPLGENYTFFLGAGESTPVAIDQQVPDEIPAGTYHVLVVTNQDRNATETNYNNDIFVAPGTISIANPFLPDLTIAGQADPAAPLPSQQIQVTWTVTNNGLSTAYNGWTDRVFLSRDSVIDGQDLQLSSDSDSSVQHGFLAAGGDYTVTKNYFMPYNAAGAYHLLIQTDAMNQQVELNDTNNLLDIPLAVPAPDFVMGSASADATANLGDTTHVAWQVSNQGDAAAQAYGWIDQVYFSLDNTFDAQDVPVSYGVYQADPLAADGSYSTSADVLIPSVAPGQYFLFVVTNDGSYAAEANHANNASTAIPVQVLAGPDLTPTAFNTPASADLGQTVSVSWTVQNAGTRPAGVAGGWSDTVYLSQDEVLDAGDRSIGTQYYSDAAVNAGDSYDLQIDALTIPAGIAPGDWHLLLAANDANAQPETNRANNVISQPIHINGPDLVPTALSVDQPSVAWGQSFGASWTVTNEGAAANSASYWIDRLYLSTDATLDSGDTPLTWDYSNYQYELPGSLAPGGSYDGQRNIVVPHAAPGDYYLLLETDATTTENPNGYQGETDETNNVRATPLTVLAGPDLAVVSSSGPQLAKVGDTIHLTFDVQNTGAGPAGVAAWYDYVYLSTDQTLDTQTDRYLGYAVYTNPGLLAAQGEYQQGVDVTIPSTATGGYYLLFATDVGNAQDEANENNNTLATSFIVGTGPELGVDQVTAPSVVTVGQPFDMSWRVTNSGANPTTVGDWSDAIYLSPDATFGNGNDIGLGTYLAGPNLPLAPGANYIGQKQLTLFSMPSGSYYLLAVTDAFEQQPEADQVSNVAAVPVQVRSPDLQITASGPPSSAPQGGSFQLPITVTNTGDGSASAASWADRVYLSSSPTVMMDSVLVGEVTHDNTDGLASTGSYQESIAVEVPTLAATGTYYLVLVTDASYKQGESSDVNNIVASLIDITVPPLPDLRVTSTTLPAGEVVKSNFVFSATVTNASTGPALQTTWNDVAYLSQTPTLAGTHYLLGTEPHSNMAGLRGGDHYTTQFAVELPEAATAGPWYIVVVADADNSQAEADETNNALAQAFALTISDLQVTGVNGPASADVGTAVTVGYTGANLGTGPATSYSWTDELYLSDSPTLDGVHYDLGGVGHANDPLLASNGTYDGSLNASLPLLDVSTPGFHANPWYLVVQADHGGTQEEGDETNNLHATPINLTVPPSQDLAVSAVTGPSNILSGGQILVSWTVTNVGEKATTGSWVDAVGLRDDSDQSFHELLSTAFDGVLAPGQSVTRTQAVFVPLTLTGDFHLEVDADRNGSLDESFRKANNAGMTPQGVHITAPPLPNLQITSVTAPAEAFSGQTAEVSWVETNTGTGTTSAPVWNDFVYLSLDDQVDNTDFLVGQATNVSYLASGDSYVSHAIVTLPQNLSGVYYLLVKADAANDRRGNPTDGNSVNEGPNEYDNVGVGSTTLIHLTPPPDLQVTSVQGQTRVFTGENLRASFSVTNVGPGATAVSTWSDNVYLSLDPTVSSDDLLLSSTTHTGRLDPGGSYDVTVQGQIPIGMQELPNDFYLLVRTDAGNEVYESAFESNNVTAAAELVSVMETPPPDLEVASVTVASQVDAGQTLEVSYHVDNSFGATPTPNSSWSDRVYLSSDDTLDPQSDPLLGTVAHQGALDVDGSYDGLLRARLPDTLAGTFYVFVVTDASHEVYEATEDNNVAVSVPLEVVSRPADLTVAAVSGDAQAQAGQNIAVSWTVRNQGVGPTTTDTWFDTVYFQPDGGDPVALAGMKHQGVLAVGGSYTQSAVVDVPWSLVGPGRLYVQANGNGAYESDYSNNYSTRLPLTIDRHLPDLRLSNLQAPATGGSGDIVHVSWTVTNNGTAGTGASYWVDGVYLSSDPFLDRNDPQLGVLSHRGALAVGDHYDAGLDVQLPITANGPYYLIVATNLDGSVAEGPGQADDVQALGGGINVTASPVPNLVVQGVTGPVSAIAGQPMQVQWTVANTGGGDTGSVRWYDSVYLSRDQVFDGGADAYVGYAANLQPLGTGQQYQQTASVNVPAGMGGPLYVFVFTNEGNQVFERGATSDNIASSSDYTTVAVPPPSDLVVGTITVPAGATPGTDATVTYTVTNNGSSPAVGNWSDALYLSADTTWDVGDALFTRVLQGRNLNPGDSYTSTATDALPALAPGQYHVILRTDIRNNMAESNEANNIGASLDHTQVDVPQLALGAPVHTQLDTRRSAYYRVDVAAGQTLLVSLDDQSPDAANELYVRYGDVPTRGVFDFAYNASGAPDQEVIVPLTKAGTYYILAYDGGTIQSNYDLTAAYLPFDVHAVDPGVIGNSGPVTLHVIGSSLTRGTLFELVGAGATVPVHSALFENSSSVYVTFDLGQAAPGVYDLRATTDSNTSTLTGAVTVAPARLAETSVSFNVPDPVRAGRGYTFPVDYGNNGNVDLPAPLILITNDSPTVIGHSRSDPIAQGDTFQFFGAAADGPAGVLRPQQGGTFGFEFLPVFHQLAQFSYEYITADDPRPVDYASLEETRRPPELPLDQWNPIWASFQSHTGATLGQYVQTLAHWATLLPAELGDPHDVTALLELELDADFARVGTSIAGSVDAPDANLDISGRDVTAFNLDTGESFRTVSLNDGSFVFPTVTAGSYKFQFSGAQITAGNQTTVADAQAVDDVRLTLGPGQTLSGVVQASAGGQLLNAASVFAVADDGTRYNAATDSNGVYTLTGLAPGTYTVVANAEGYAQSRVTGLVVGSDPVSHPFTLVSESQITGNISLSDNGAAGGVAEVEAQLSGATGPGSTFFAQFTDSSFRFSGLPAGDYTLTATRAGYLSASAQITVAQGATADAGTLDLALAGSISGQVAPTGPGVSAANVIIEVRDADHPDNLITVAQSDSLGGFEIDGLQPGNYLLRTTPAAGFGADTNLTLGAGSVLTGVSLPVQPGGTIAGSVTNSNTGDGLMGVPLAIYGPNGIVPQAVFTNASGDYSVTGLPLGHYVVTAQLGDTAVNPGVDVTQLDGTPADADLALPVAGQLLGQLLDHAGQPIGGSVSLVQAGQVIGTTSAGANGRFGFFLSTAGTYDLTAVSDDATFADATGIVVAENATVTQDLTGGTATLNLTLTSAGGNLDTVIVQLLRNDGGTLVPSMIGYADASGHVTFAGLAAGDYQVVAEAADNRAATLDLTVALGDSSTPTLPLQDLGGLSGTVTDGSTPVANAIVRLENTGDPQDLHLTLTDASGQYSLPHVKPGDYRLAVLAGGFAASVQTVTVSAADTHDITLAASTTNLHGRVVDPLGQPVHNGLLTVLDSGGQVIGMMVLANDGTFSLSSAAGTDLTLQLVTQVAPPVTLAGLTVAAGAAVDLGNVQVHPRALAFDATPTVSPLRSLVAPLSAAQPGWVQTFIYRLYLESLLPYSHDALDRPSIPNECLDDCKPYIDAFENARSDVVTLRDIVQAKRDLARTDLWDAVGSSVLNFAQLAGTAANIGASILSVGESLEAEVAVKTALRNGIDIAGNLAQLGSAIWSVSKSIASMDAAQSIKDTQAVFNNMAQAEGNFAQGFTNFVELTKALWPKDVVAVNPGAGLGATVATAILGWQGTIDDLTNEIDRIRVTLNLVSNDMDDYEAAKKAYYDGIERARDAKWELAACVAHCKDPTAPPPPPLKKVTRVRVIHTGQPGGPPGGAPTGGGAQGANGPGGGHGGTASPDVLKPMDPNDIIGPAGIGAEHWLAVNSASPAALGYTIEFENMAAATAPAQEVIITMQLDPSLDPRTFRVGDFGWGAYHFTLPGNRGFVNERLDTFADLGFDVDFSAAVDVHTGIVTWHFTSVDPATGEKPVDPRMGFLPPTDASGVGDAFVQYAVKPQRGIASGTVINAQSTVVFDTEPPLDTPKIFNTLDAESPASQIDSVTLTRPGGTGALALVDGLPVDVAWSGQDDANGSGITGFNVYVSDNGGPFTVWLGDTQTTRGTYIGQPEHTYAFYVNAHDLAGNAELSPSQPDGAMLAMFELVANNDSAELAENSAATEIPVMANDVAIADSPLAFSISAVTQGANGHVSILTDGSGLTYLPDGDYSGPDTFTYTISSAQGLTDTATVNITITPTPGPVVGSLVTNPGPVLRGLPLTLTAHNVVDLTGTVASVAFYRDTNGNGQLDVGTDTPLGPGTRAGNDWSIVVATDSFALGANTFFAVATDDHAAASPVAHLSADVKAVLHFQGRAVATYTDESGDLVTVALTGPGSGIVVLNHAGHSDAALVRLTDTTIASALTIVTKGTATTGVGGIEVRPGTTGTGALKSITASTTSLLGDVTVPGFLGILALANIAGPSVISLGGSFNLAANPKASVKITLNQVTDLTLHSGIPLSALTVLDWEDTDATPDVITAPGIATLRVLGSKTVAGNFAAGLDLSGAPAGDTLGTATIKGLITSAGWTIAGSINTAKSAGVAAGWDLEAAGRATTLDFGYGNFDGTLAADFFGTVKTTGALTGQITARSHDIRGVAVGTLQAGRVNGLTLHAVAGQVKTVKVIDWTGGTITALSLDSLTTTGVRGGPAGDFMADVTLTLANAAKLTLNRFTVAGTLTDSRVTSAGNVGTLTLGAMNGSQLLVGTAAGITGLAANRGDFAFEPAKPTLATLTVKGLAANQSSLRNSVIDAWNIGRASLKLVDIVAGATPVGFAADKIGSLSFLANGVNNNKPIALSILDTDADLLNPRKNPAGVKLPLGSLNVRLV